MTQLARNRFMNFAIYFLKHRGSSAARNIITVLALATLWTSVLAPRMAAQGLAPDMLLAPPTNTWPTYNGEYSGRRYSTLDQINASNINSLTLAWVYRANGTIKSTPLEVNGIL